MSRKRYKINKIEKEFKDHLYTGWGFTPECNKVGCDICKKYIVYKLTGDRK